MSGTRKIFTVAIAMLRSSVTLAIHRRWSLFHVPLQCQCPLHDGFWGSRTFFSHGESVTSVPRNFPITGPRNKTGFLETVFFCLDKTWPYSNRARERGGGWSRRRAHFQHALRPPGISAGTGRSKLFQAVDFSTACRIYLRLRLPLVLG